MVCCILTLVACNAHNEEDTVEVYKPTMSKDCKYCKSRFFATKFTLAHIDGTLQKFKMTAAELSIKQRKGRVVEFYDHDELFFKDLIIDQPLSTKIVKFDITEINSLMTIGGNPGTNNQGIVVNQTAKQTGSEVLGNKLNRISGHDIKINFKPSSIKNHPIVLTADSAKILTDTMTMRFEGKVTLDAAKCQLSSRVAVWSNSYNGLFFSESFQLNNKTFKPPAFFQITDTGKCQMVKSIKNVEYIDNLAIIEEKMLQSVPMSIQLLFGLLGTSTNF